MQMTLADLDSTVLNDQHIILLRDARDRIVRDFNRQEKALYTDLLSAGLITNLYPHFRITAKGRHALEKWDRTMTVGSSAHEDTVEAGVPVTEEHPASTESSSLDTSVDEA